MGLTEGQAEGQAKGGVAGLVLAGGASRRMGRDKAAIVVGERTLLDRALQTLATFADPVVVAAGPVFRDDVPDDVAQVLDGEAEGPLAGLLAGLQYASETVPALAVLSVDAPAVPGELYSALLRRWTGEDAVVLVADGHVQPLLAVYATAVTGELRDAVAGGERSPSRWLLGRRVRLVPIGELAEEGVATNAARNVNTPEELRDFYDGSPRTR